MTPVPPKVFVVFMAYAVGMFITAVFFLAELVYKRSGPRLQEDFQKLDAPMKFAIESK